MVSRSKAIALAIVVLAVSFSAYYIYDHNDGFGTDTDFKIVVSGSMDGERRTQYEIDTIPLGSLIWIKKVPTDPQTASDFYKNIAIGDVLTFSYTHPISKESMVVTHRVIDILESEGVFTYTLKGDSIDDDPTNGSTQTVTSASGDIIGKVSGVSPWLGQLTIFLSTMEGKIALIAIPCLILVAAEVSNIIRNVRKIREDSDRQQSIPDCIQDGSDAR